MKHSLLLAAWLVAAPVFAATRYLNLNTGNDTRTGLAPATAWRTWAFALNHVAAGDTLVVVNGTYNNKIPYFDPPLYPSFPATNPVLIKAQTTGSVKFKGGGGSGEGISMDGLSGYVWEGFDIQRAPSNVVHIQNAHHITFRNCKIHDALPGGDGDVVKINQCHHIRFEGCEIYDPSQRSAQPEFYQECFDIVDADDSVLRNCWVYHTGSRGTILAYCKGGTHRNVFEGCVFGPQSTASDQPAVLFGGSTDPWLFQSGELHESEDMVMRNNIFWQCRWAAVGFYDALDSWLYNNLFVNCGGRVRKPVFGAQNEISQGIMQFRAGMGSAEETRNVFVRNNIFLDTDGEMPAVLHDQQCHAVHNVQISNNLYWNVGRAIPRCGFHDPATEIAGKWQQDPLVAFDPATFTSYANIVAAFSIAANSPIWNAGANATNLPEPGVTTDILGAPRNFGPATDIGPWERQSAATAPAPTVLCSPTATLTPTQDSYLNWWEPTENVGKDQHLFLWGGYEGFNTGNGAERRTPILRFSLTGIPTNAIVTAATLVLTPDPALGAESSNGCSEPEHNGVLWLEPLKKSWTEGTGTTAAPTTNGASWNRRNAAVSSNWTMPGGDADTVNFALRYNTIFPATHPTFGIVERFDVTPLVKRWVLKPGSNYGLLIRAFNGGKYYWSRESPDASKRPKLEICYVVPPATELADSRQSLENETVERISEELFSFVPNPSGGLFSVNTNSEMPDDARIVVFDFAGREVLAQNLGVVNAVGQLDMSNTQPGFYTYVIWSSGGATLQQGKLLITR